MSFLKVVKSHISLEGLMGWLLPVWPIVLGSFILSILSSSCISRLLLVHFSAHLVLTCTWATLPLTGYDSLLRAPVCALSVSQMPFLFLQFIPVCLWAQLCSYFLQEALSETRTRHNLLRLQHHHSHFHSLSNVFMAVTETSWRSNIYSLPGHRLLRADCFCHFHSCTPRPSTMPGT